MSTPKRISLFAVAALVAISGCSTDRDPATLFAPDAGVLVIDAAMIVGKPFPVVFLTETVAANAVFDIRAAAVSGATMQIAGGGFVMPYTELQPGVYLPANAGAIVLWSTTYEITVHSADGRTLSAKTTTPDRFQIDRWVLLDESGTTVTRELRKFTDVADPDRVYYDNELVYTEGLLEGWFQETIQPGYQAALFSLDPGSPLLIDPDFLNDEDLEDFERNVSSPPFADLEGQIRLPWLAVTFEGRYKIKIYALDQNWFDFARSDPTVSGGFGFGGNTGDNFEKPIFHVEGGIGLFGSAAVDSVGIYVLPRP